MASPNVIDKAAAAFKKEERQREGAKAMVEYKAALAAEEKKTERLRALRLAREAAAPAEAEVKPKPRKLKTNPREVKAKTRTAKTKSPAANPKSQRSA